MNIYLLIINITGLFIFLFIFWEKMKEDYIANQIFSTAFSIILGLILANILARLILPNWWFWLSFVGISVGFVTNIIRFKLRILETLDAIIIAVLPWLGLIFLEHAVVNSNLHSFVGVFVIAFLIGFYLFIESHYRKFTWYKSGRLGFSGLATVGLFFLIRGAIAVLFNDMLSFSGKSDPFLSAMVAFASIFTLYNLARRKQ